MKNSISIDEYLESDIKALKGGIVSYEDGSVCRIYAIFDRAAAEASVGWVADNGNTEFAERLTGWYGRSSTGPGRSFAEDPDIRVFRHKILVVQQRGIDI